MLKKRSEGLWRKSIFIISNTMKGTEDLYSIWTQTMKYQNYSTFHFEYLKSLVFVIFTKKDPKCESKES